MVRDTPTPTVHVDVAYEQQPSVPDDESTASTQATIAQVVAPVAPGPREVENATHEVHLYAPRMHPPLLSQRYVVCHNLTTLH